MNDSMIDILLIDDNREEAMLTMRTLRKQNPTKNIQYMQDSEEAVRMIFSSDLVHLPKLILLDLKMPKLDGIDVLRKLKSDPRCRVIPVVMLTSSREEADVVETYQLGVNAYIVKPVDPDKFIHAISEIGMFWANLNTTTS